LLPQVEAEYEPRAAVATQPSQPQVSPPQDVTVLGNALDTYGAQLQFPVAETQDGEDEWIEVAHWLYENWDILGGLSFLPRHSHVYQLAPYEEITKEQYLELEKRFVNVDYGKLMTYELQDETEMKQELACAGGTCKI